MGNGKIEGIQVVHGAVTDLYNRFNVVIISEGYTTDRLTQFHADVALVLSTILQNIAIDGNAISVTRIDVSSKQGGADAPGLLVDTFFDGAFDPKTNVLSVSQATVDTTVIQEMKQLGDGIHVHKIVVLIDTLLAGGGGAPVEVGGGGATIAVASNQVKTQTVVHELGHTFGLGDEYSGAPWMDTDPPNVSRTANHDQLPWRGQLHPQNVALPTSLAAPLDTIGAFEIQGAPDQRFRPMHDCMMNSVSAPFCTVCDGSIRSTLKGSTSNG
jgi:hypothetical protein